MGAPKPAVAADVASRAVAFCLVAFYSALFTHRASWQRGAAAETCVGPTKRDTVI